MRGRYVIGRQQEFDQSRRWMRSRSAIEFPWPSGRLVSDLTCGECQITKERGRGPLMADARAATSTSVDDYCDWHATDETVGDQYSDMKGTGRATLSSKHLPDGSRPQG